ncbi:alpha/beta-hydrolase [Viridothelium virens]|uniref:Alpha/beta-hydrolase n=1 Tax=Viridothelium virens TaxID=1048519 RepID=A0A6A6H926_VIRVR|nr:alpha/beta-hydrolase [Viridothelium virens]
MTGTEEGWHAVEDGTRLYTKTWKPDSNPKARMVLIHGFSDHCNTYNNFCNLLASKGIEVRSFDQRGWGRSAPTPSSRGASGPTPLVLSDISSFVSSLPTPQTPTPLFLFGHSMGGAEVLHWLASPLVPTALKHRIRGYLLDAPFIAIHPSTRPSPFTVFAGRLAGKVLPKRQLVNQVEPKFLSRDQEVGRVIAEDQLCHDTGTLEGMAGMLDRAGELEKGRVRMREEMGEGGKTRLWVSHGTDDRVCAFAATRKVVDEFMGEVGDKEFKVYEGWYHRLHDEPGECRETYANDVANWIFARLELPSEATPASDSKSRL